jgi:poly [ADP-ribose] polymerase 2/3/4
VTEDPTKNEEESKTGEGKKQEGLQKKEEEDFEKSKLDQPVKNLVQLIFDLKMMNQQMKEIGYDAKKMPLGKLSKSNIEKGYKILTEIAEELKGKKARNKLETLSSDFYSFIPHDFGFQ